MKFLILVFAFQVLPSAYAEPQLPSVECTAKRLDSKTGEYDEEKLKIGNDSNGLYTAQLQVKDCYFQAQSNNPEIFQLAVRQTVQDVGLSQYGGFDTKGHMIATLSQDKANFICMLICSRTAHK